MGYDNIAREITPVVEKLVSLQIWKGTWEILSALNIKGENLSHVNNGKYNTGH